MQADPVGLVTVIISITPMILTLPQMFYLDALCSLGPSVRQGKCKAFSSGATKYNFPNAYKSLLKAFRNYCICYKSEGNTIHPSVVTDPIEFL